jgi:hypothetical protein
VQDLKSEVGGNYEHLIVALMKDRAHLDATVLRAAMKGIGTDEQGGCSRRRHGAAGIPPLAVPDGGGWACLAVCCLLPLVTGGSVDRDHLHPHQRGDQGGSSGLCRA